MKLLNSLFTIVSDQQTASGHDYTIDLDKEHFIYKAHFPGEPITPGVCVMQIAKELFQEALGQKLDLVCVKNVKFLKIISPNEVTRVCYSLSKISSDEAGQKVQVSVIDDLNVYAKLSLICRTL